jgi:hypothetical protein
MAVLVNGLIEGTSNDFFPTENGPGAFPYLSQHSIMINRKLHRHFLTFPS